MIEVKDRIPTKPNRILITPENGDAPFYATWERADEPIEDGTPVNKLLFDSIEEGGYNGSGVDDIEVHARKVTIGAEWTTVKFQKPFSGVPRVFVSVSDVSLPVVKNVTATDCQVAVYAPTMDADATYIIGFEFTAATIEVLAVYDGGVNV